MDQTTIGIDVSRDTLDVHRLPEGSNRRFANTAAGHRQLIAWIGPKPERIVYEATGTYHRAMETALAKAGLSLAKVNPARAHRFAEAVGQPAKTDPSRCGHVGTHGPSARFWNLARSRTNGSARCASCSTAQGSGGAQGSGARSRRLPEP